MTGRVPLAVRHDRGLGNGRKAAGVRPAGQFRIAGIEVQARRAAHFGDFGPPATRGDRNSRYSTLNTG